MPIIAITPGDPAGIGAEIVWITIQRGGWQKGFHLLCVGARKPFDKLGAKVVETSPKYLRKGITPPKIKKPFVWLLAAPTIPPKPGLLLEGFQSGWSITQATRLVQTGIASALTTGPISKERLQKGGYYFSGHTDFLANLCGAKHVTMMLANKQLRIALVTIHIALKDVPKNITRLSLERTILQTATSLKDWWKIKYPHIGIAALNPHSGEGGLFGNEEIKIIEPTIKALQKNAGHLFKLSGPLPADTLFAKHVTSSQNQRFDSVICMYHDQGLIPVKLLDFQKTVNITLGLPIIRTSVDHGVGFDIIGKGKADPSSLQSAIDLAISLVNKKQRKQL